MVDADPETLQSRSLAHTGQHQQLGRCVGSGGDNHFPGQQLLRRTGALDLDPNRPTLFDQHALHQGARDHFQVGTGANRIDVRGDHGFAPAVAYRRLARPEAFRVGRVEIRAAPVAQRGSRFQEAADKGVGSRNVHNIHRAAAAVIARLRPGLVALRLAEVRQHFLVRPTGRAVGHPIVEVAGMAAEISHSIDGAAAAEDTAARQRDLTRVQMPLGHTLVAPAYLRVRYRSRHRGRDSDLGARIRGPGLKQGHRHLGIGGQPVREHAARRTAAHDHVVEPIGTDLHCWPQGQSAADTTMSPRRWKRSMLSLLSMTPAVRQTNVRSSSGSTQ